MSFDLEDFLMHGGNPRGHSTEVPKEGFVTEGCHEALRWALDQWAMYADATRGREGDEFDRLGRGTDAEALRYQRCARALPATPPTAASEGKP